LKSLDPEIVNAVNNSQLQVYRAAMQLFAERGVSQVTVKDLAQAAGVARGTIYNNFSSIEDLFEDVAGNLAHDMNDRVIRSCGETTDPAIRLATGMRLYVRRAHEEPDWGRFVIRFGLGVTTMRHMWDGQPMEDLRTGINRGRYSIRKDQLPSAVSLVAGAVISACFLVQEGIKGWREAGSNAAEITLTGFGVPRHEARAIAFGELPPLVPSA